jgi:hypothetical protein
MSCPPVKLAKVIENLPLGDLVEGAHYLCDMLFLWYINQILVPSGRTGPVIQ